MAEDDRDILEVLKSELSFLEQGGYGRSVRTPWKATSIFQDSPSCINFDDAQRPLPCHECLLIDFVPGEARAEDVPCHHIPLDEAGHTVETLERRYNQRQVEETLIAWLRRTIEHIERERAAQQRTAG